MKEFLTQGHSPVKQNTLEQKQWAAHPRQGWFTLLPLKCFTCFSISSWEFPTSSFRASISCVKAFSMTKQDRVGQWKHKNTTKMDATDWLITLECHAVTDKCGCGTNTQRNCRDCTQIPEQSSPCLLLLGFQLVGVLPLILFFHPSRGSLKRAKKQHKLAEKNVLLKQIKKIWSCYPIPSHHQPQGSTVGPGKRNK